MIVTLNLTTSLYGPQNEDGEQKCIKKNIIYKRTFNTNEITIGHYITSKGKLSKTMTMIYFNGSEFVAKHKFEYLEALTKQVKILGFKEWK